MRIPWGFNPVRRSDHHNLAYLTLVGHGTIAPPRSLPSCANKHSVPSLSSAGVRRGWLGLGADVGSFDETGSATNGSDIEKTGTNRFDITLESGRTANCDSLAHSLTWVKCNLKSEDGDRPFSHA